jgi:hypothetical protein
VCAWRRRTAAPARHLTRTAVRLETRVAAVKIGQLLSLTACTTLALHPCQTELEPQCAFGLLRFDHFPGTVPTARLSPHCHRQAGGLGGSEPSGATGQGAGFPISVFQPQLKPPCHWHLSELGSAGRVQKPLWRSRARTAASGFLPWREFEPLLISWYGVHRDPALCRDAWTAPGHNEAALAQEIADGAKRHGQDLGMQGAGYKLW